MRLLRPNYAQNGAGRAFFEGAGKGYPCYSDRCYLPAYPQNYASLGGLRMRGWGKTLISTTASIPNPGPVSV